MYQDVKETYMPILWFEQRVKMDDAAANEIKLALNMPTTGRIAGIVLCVVGIIMSIWYPLDNLIRRKRQIKPNDIQDLNKIVNKAEVSPLLIIKNGCKNVEITLMNDNKSSEKMETNIC